MLCRGDGDDHCCHLGRYGVCEYLDRQEPDENGRRWVCRLRASLGSWDAVYIDRRYTGRVRPKLDDIGVVQDCGDWPPPGHRCGTCGGCD